MIEGRIARFGVCEFEFLRFPMNIPDLVEVDSVIFVFDVETEERFDRSVVSEFESFAEVRQA
jgi:hypothetical protein